MPRLNYLDGRCGAIQLINNSFIDNIGCGRTVGSVNILCPINDQSEYSFVTLGSNFRTDYPTVDLSTKAFTLPEYAPELVYGPYQIIFENNTFQNNLAIIASSVYVFGARSVFFKNNSFSGNGVFREGMEPLLSYQIRKWYDSTVQFASWWEFDDTTLMKESSAIFLALCDDITMNNNTFSENFSNFFQLYRFLILIIDLPTGDTYWGVAVNLYLTLGLHNVDFFFSIMPKLMNLFPPISSRLLTTHTLIMVGFPLISQT